MTLGRELRHYRAEHGLSQEGMARKLDVSIKTYVRWELDRNFPRPRRCRQIEQQLGIHVEPPELDGRFARPRVRLIQGDVLETVCFVSLKRNGELRQWYAKSDEVYLHRKAWEWKNGPLPEGLVVHHMCFQKACINPDHLEAITRNENSRIGGLKDAA